MNNRQMILPDVYLTAVRSDKFKTGCMSLSILRPLRREEASANALIPSVLLRGSERYPDMTSISEFLDERYGASIGTLIRKKGEVQAVGFFSDFLEDAFALQGEAVLEEMVNFLGEVLLQPHLENGRFSSAFVEGEKQNLTNTIEARINDKRSYVLHQLLRTMCRDEDYGIPRLGDAEDVAKLDAGSLYRQYRNILTHSSIEIFYLGRCGADRVAELLRGALRDLPRGPVEPFGTRVIRQAERVSEAEEHLDVTQGKLAMGLRLGCTAADETYPAALLMNTVFGAGVTSKLFLNVREKLSLCYYASSTLEKFKGVMVISSGVEFADFGAARAEILRQLDECRKGNISDEELESARTYLLSSLRTGMDSPGRQDDYSIGQVILGRGGTMEDLANELKTVTKEQVSQAAARVSVDTVYLLKGASA